MLPKRWNTLERQRPALKWVKWGEIVGIVLALGGFVGIGSWLFGLLVMAGFGLWGFRILNR
jgi:hypothetical protein